MMTDVGKLFRQARERQGVSQAHVARATGLSPSTIIRTEQGRVVPTAQNAFAIADVLKVPYDQLREAFPVPELSVDLA